MPDLVTRRQANGSRGVTRTFSNELSRAGRCEARQRGTADTAHNGGVGRRWIGRVQQHRQGGTLRGPLDRFADAHEAQEHSQPYAEQGVNCDVFGAEPPARGGMQRHPRAVAVPSDRVYGGRSEVASELPASDVPGERRGDRFRHRQDAFVFGSVRGARVIVRENVDAGKGRRGSTRWGAASVVGSDRLFVLVADVAARTCSVVDEIPGFTTLSRCPEGHRRDRRDRGNVQADDRRQDRIQGIQRQDRLRHACACALSLYLCGTAFCGAFARLVLVRVLVFVRFGIKWSPAD